MGASTSKIDNGNNVSSFQSAEPINIVFTTDVFKRWAMLAAPSPKIPAKSEEIAFSKLIKNGEGITPPNSGGGQQSDHVIGEAGDGGKVANHSADLPSSSFNTVVEQTLDLEDLIGSAKESLRSQITELQEDKILLGIGPEGRPTFETVGAWQVRQQKEEELFQNDLAWTEKLERLKEKYTSSISEDFDGFLQKVENINEFFPPPKENMCMPLCSKVADCYAANQNRVINCRTVVQEFTQCVQRSENQ